MQIFRQQLHWRESKFPLMKYDVLSFQAECVKIWWRSQPKILQYKLLHNFNHSNNTTHAMYWQKMSVTLDLSFVFCITLLFIYQYMYALWVRVLKRDENSELIL